MRMVISLLVCAFSGLGWSTESRLSDQMSSAIAFPYLGVIWASAPWGNSIEKSAETLPKNRNSNGLLGQAAVPFEVSLPLEIPSAAFRPLKTYLDLLVASRPIPMDYLLESYSIDAKRGVLHLSGRFMKGGPHTLFLGTFVWGNTVVGLPPVEVTVAPLQEISLAGQDILLPFPELFLQETKVNVTLRKALVDQYLSEGERLLRGQRRFRDGIVGFLFLLVVTPVLFFVLGRKIESWRRVQSSISPKEELRFVRKSRDWTKLLALLQKISGRKECLTSYELAEFFSGEKNQTLAKAALIIERHGYLRESAPQQFDEAIRCVREAFRDRT